jgi:chromosomal replication initiation ATPase DnaA
MTHHRQLPLPFRFQPRFDRVDFMSDDSNQAALAWLDRAADWPDRRLLLWGEAGCGKTHLLHAWAAETGSILLDGPNLRIAPPASIGFVIDDADLVPDEAVLLHLLNVARDEGVPVLLSARTPPARWTIALPDLSSRLRAITAVEIGHPGPGLLRALLMRLLSERQLRVDEALQEWLLLRLPRSPGALREAVRRLDRAALAAGGRITRSLASAEIQAAEMMEEGMPDAALQDISAASFFDNAQTRWLL